MTGQIRRRTGASRYRSCERKANKYPTRKAAQEACDKFMSDKPWSLEKVVYRCPWGDHYHYGAPLDRNTR